MMSNMKKSLLLLVLLIIITYDVSVVVVVVADEETTVKENINNTIESVDICQQKNIEINEAFYLISNKQLNIYPKGGQYYYRVHGFEYNRENLSFKFKSIDKVIDNKKDWELQEMRLIFKIDYPLNDKHQLRILWMGMSLRDEIPNEQMVAYLYDYNGDTIASKSPININYYKYKPNDEPLNIQTMLAKFPGINLFDHLLSVTSFPYSPDLPNRLIVYYKETPPKSKQDKCVDCYRSKRFVFIERIIDYNDSKEFDWNHDNTGDESCTDLTGRIVNASVALTDYLINENSYQFDWIEFFGNKFHVNRMLVTKDNGFKIVNKRSDEYIIHDIFGCEGRPPTELTTKPTTTKLTTNDNNGVNSHTSSGNNSSAGPDSGSAISPNNAVTVAASGDEPHRSGSQSKKGDNSSKWRTIVLICALIYSFF
ncbi:uncharacterized protein LOC128965539 [Oppia nitens]|uniref:uncharacterized protein LOC128965539 n=1 Tax=Oppia nitens TaxID=1686743 RepID=UPI0023DCDA4E|nr:uncharacterized protein LOC128965539 [Oppia nitens]